MASLKTRLGALQARLGGRRTPPAPVLSVVVPVYNVAAFLPACLDSLLGQTLSELEVICVDDGSSDDSYRILQEYAAADPRVRVLQQANAGQGAARNTAMPHVRGEFLAFADSDDEVPSDAYQAMVETLRRTGSDWVLGGARRYTHGQLLEVVRGAAVHDRDRLGVRLDDFPVALQDIIPGNRLFRTAFYRERVPAYRSDVKYEDQVPCLAAFARGKFDVLERVTYLWRIREDASSTTQQKTTLRNLLDQVEVMHEARELMRADASPVGYDAWVGRMIGVDLNGFVQPALAADEEFRTVLTAAYREVLPEATPRALAHASVSAKVRASLIGGEEADWAGVLAFEEYAQVHGRVPPTRVVDGRVLAEPGDEEPWPRVPPAMRELGAYETPLRAAVHDVAVEGAELVIRGYAGIGAIDSLTYPPLVQAWLGEVPSTVELHRDQNADLWAKDLNASFAAGAFVARVPLGSLPAGTSVLRLQVDQAGLVREGTVHEVVEHSGAARLAPLGAAGRIVTPSLGDHGFAVTLDRGEAPVTEEGPRLWITSLTIEDAAPTAPTAQIAVGVRFSGLEPDEVAGAELGTRDVVVAPASSYQPTGAGSGVLRFPTRVSRPGAPSVALEQRAGGLWVPRNGRPPIAARPAPELSADLPLVALGADLRLHLRLRPTGQAQLVPRSPLQPEEVTRYGRARLRAAYRAAEGIAAGVPSAAVLFWSDKGHRADGGLAALDAELARTRPDVARLWAVQGHDVVVPDGAVPLVIDSAAWYDALRSVPVLVADAALPEWFLKRPHQRLVHVAPGWPVVSLGAAHAVERGLPAGLTALLARQVQAWDLLVAPGEEAVEIYRRETGYAGEVLLAAPQTDALLGPAAELRARVRAELGLGPQTRAVLYAPTYRDARSSRVEAAPMYDGLDLGALAERLGPGYAVLVRAHRFDARAAEKRVRRTPVLDVSLYPRLEHLLLAADAAVFDYGPARIDWALTGKPAVLLTRDRDAYFAVRAPLLDYDATLPGPTADSTQDVAALLGDLPALAESCGPLAERVTERYLTEADGRGAERVVTRLAGWL
ncbi:CDP-glycerol glycerophosphotransferase family protein [Nocardioides sp. BP30]|uniref:bifunctional glycosyltransferase/CDP-glycerol:glycerophosphate glycerophosphotransferase n=1 Tax=Nocardioides sp. BP30 TaxID=3036374 RepID=UPI002469249D|nr:CDP-glycerol glycerophosphotransferase family protein [Nocardioides sp. BP30]WGL52884.1 CDP-glycerol glycerophosphotransferase family protein [Nocardioides sp. BP30]